MLNKKFKTLLQNFISNKTEGKRNFYQVSNKNKAADAKYWFSPFKPNPLNKNNHTDSCKNNNIRHKNHITATQANKFTHTNTNC